MAGVGKRYLKEGQERARRAEDLVEDGL